jgi:enterochelin esterase-like enzyme
MKLASRLVLSAALAVSLTGLLLSQTNAPKGPLKGTIERIKVHGKSLEGNLEGDSDRDVIVYLPPRYQTNKNQRYPVVYFLHGYGIGAEAYWNMMKVPDATDRDVAAGTVKEMILVHPDANTIYNGSMYSNSPTTGDWEAYITQDLVSYIDSHYRTLADRMNRGLAGHSMGGYGTIRIGMKYPEVFSSLYIMSACCLLNNPGAQGQGRGGQDKAKQPAANTAKADTTKADPGKAGDGKGKNAKGGGFGNVNFAEAAAWSPNPMNPPQFFDLPTKDGKVQPAIAAKWVANSPLAMFDQYVPNLKKYHAIAGDCGLQDGLVGSNQELDQAFGRFGIQHTFETYEGTHTSKVGERFEFKVLPFFSNNLSFAKVKPVAKVKN